MITQSGPYILSMWLETNIELMFIVIIQLLDSSFIVVLFLLSTFMRDGFHSLNCTNEL